MSNELTTKRTRMMRSLDEVISLPHQRSAIAVYIDELETLIGDLTETLIWASGAFDTEEKSELWALHGRPTLERALQLSRQGTGT